MAESEHIISARYYVPEIHDIYPGMETQLDAMLDIWPHDVGAQLALLVVPNWQEKFPLRDRTRFTQRIAAHPGEKVLHGWTHSLGPDFWNWLMYGHDNRSEFASLGNEDAQMRISAGVEAFKAHFGAPPRWFCGPRWQQSAAATEVLRQSGFHGYMLRGSLRTFSGEKAALPSLCFDEGERRLKTVPARIFRDFTINRLFAAGRPFRITLHPDDLKDAATWRQVNRVMTRLAEEGWTPVGPDEAVKRMQQIASSAENNATQQA